MKAIIVAALLACSAHAGETGTVSVSVTSAAGAPIRNALVTLNERGHSSTATTAADGKANVTAPVGPCTVLVSLGGSIVDESIVRVTAGRPTPLVVRVR